MQNSTPFRVLISFLLLIVCTSEVRAQKSAGKLHIRHLTDSFYIFTTYKTYDDAKVTFPANGLYLVTSEGIVMIDCPWDTTQFQPLLDTLWTRHHKKVLMCVATHSHDDRTAALEYYRSKGIKTYTTLQTDSLSARRGEKRAEFLLTKDTLFTVGGYSFQTYYPGAGHSPDNIVVWFGAHRILHGGCLVKSTDATDLGNVKDANLKEWPESIKRIQKKFGKFNFIIPGHYSWESRNALQHTLKLLEQHGR